MALVLAAAGLVVATPALAMIGAPTVHTDAAGVTSVVQTQGKARGSGLWGYAGDVSTRPANNVFTYGVAVNPVDGSLWATDSAKVFYRQRSGNAFLDGAYLQFFTSECNSRGGTYSNGTAAASTSCYVGTSRVMRFALEQDDWTLGQYATDGTYAAVPAGENAGVGAAYATYADATVIDGSDLASGKFGGARGVTALSSGNVWVTDPDSPVRPYVMNQSKSGLLFAPDMSQLNAIGDATSTYAQRNNPYFLAYNAGIAADSRDHVYMAVQGYTGLVKEYTADGTYVRSLLLDQPAGTEGASDAGYRDPYALAVDPATDDLLVGPTAQSPGASGFIERIDPTSCTTRAFDRPVGTFVDQCTVLKRIGVGVLPASSAIYAIGVDPLTRDIYVGTQSGTLFVFGADGASKGRFSAFGGGTRNGQVATVRAITFDKRGFLYLTTSEGTADGRIEIFARTPEPVTGLTAQYTDATRTTVNLAWDALPAGVTADAQAPVKDYVVEHSSDAGATWTVVPTATSTAATEAVAGLSGASGDMFRVSAWNEAGNGNWIIATAVDAPSTLTVVKTGDGIETATPDDAVHVDADTTVTFTYVVTNNGPSETTAVTVTDSVLGVIDAPSGFTGALAAGASVEFTADGPVAAGAYTNSVTARGVSQGADISAQDTWWGFGVTRGVTVEKTGAGESAPTVADAVDVPAGSSVPFAYTVRNVGNVPVTDIVLTDDKIAALTAPVGWDGTLAVGQSVTFTAAGPVAAGVYVNTAAVTGIAAGEDVGDTATWHGFGVVTALSVSKTGDGVANSSAAGAHRVPAGDDVTFAYTVHNGSNVAVTIDTVTDDVLGRLQAPVGFDGMLAPGADVVFTAVGAVPAGAYHNTVTVRATSSTAGAPSLTAHDDWFGFGVIAGVTVVKTGAGEISRDSTDPLTVPAGDVAFTYAVTNSSNVDLTLIGVADSVLGAIPAPAGFDGVLAPNESATFTATGAVPAGAYHNAVVASGTTGELTTDASDHWYGFGETASISVAKTGDGVTADTPGARRSVEAGDDIRFTYTIVNTGNTAVTLGDVVDSKVGVIAAPAGFSGVLAPGASVVFVASGIVVAGDYENTVDVSGRTAARTPVTANHVWFGFGTVTPSPSPTEPTTTPTPTETPTVEPTTTPTVEPTTTPTVEPTTTPTVEPTTTPTVEPTTTPTVGPTAAPTPPGLPATGLASPKTALVVAGIVLAAGILLLTRRRTAR